MAYETRAQLAEQRDEALMRLDDVRSEVMAEAYADAAAMLMNTMGGEEIGWIKLGLSQTDVAGITLQTAKSVSKKLHEAAVSNPLLARGREIRASYLFSAQYEIGTEDAAGKITPQQMNRFKNVKNQNAVFGMEALERIEGERYSAGNAFVLYDRTERTFQQISFQDIGAIIYNPDDSSEPWYVMREWEATIIDAEGNTQIVENKMWYPSSRYNPQKFAKVIDRVKVDTNKRMIVERVNVQPGGNLGVPDSFAAAPWAMAYNAYLSDGSKVLAALAEWAWLVKPKKKNPAERAAASVRSERGAGSTLFTDADVQAMPSKNAVDLTTGRPLASQVAAALGVSVVLLLADPGQSGAYGTAQTLSDPNRRTMEARRQRNTAFLVHCLELIGIEKPAVQWPKMSPGSDLDETTLVNMVFGTGMFHEDEVRPRLAELAHITVLHDTPPEGFMYPNNENSQARADVDADGSDVSASDGSNSMVNGQGRSNIANAGNISHRKADTKKPVADVKST